MHWIRFCFQTDRKSCHTRSWHFGLSYSQCEWTHQRDFQQGGMFIPNWLRAKVYFSLTTLQFSFNFMGLTGKLQSKTHLLCREYKIHLSIAREKSQVWSHSAYIADWGMQNKIVRAEGQYRNAQLIITLPQIKREKRLFYSTRFCKLRLMWKRGQVKIRN